MTLKSIRGKFILIFLIMFLIPSNSNFVQAADVIDVRQETTNQSFWIDQNLVHWQEFTPEKPELTRFDIALLVNGNPGNLIIEINDTYGKVWNSSFVYTSITTGWNNFTLTYPLGVVPGALYKIIVYSDTVSPSPSDRYFWNGDTSGSLAEESSLSITSSTWENYDFSLVTWTANPSNDKDIQKIQEEVINTNFASRITNNYCEKWQELLPIYTSVSRIDLYLSYNGSVVTDDTVGNIILRFVDNDFNPLYSQKLLSGDVISGWNNITLENGGFHLNDSTYLCLNTEKTSTSENDYFLWRADGASSYPGKSTFTPFTPGFDFTFVLWTGSSILDQNQEMDDYGFYFDLNNLQTQHFTPHQNSITRVDFKLGINGSPGDILVMIVDGNDVIWSDYLGGQNVIVGWNTVLVDKSVRLDTDKVYSLSLRTQVVSDVSNRYFWRGHTNSDYIHSNSRSGGWPEFDFAFRTYGVYASTNIKNVTHSYSAVTTSTDVTIDVFALDIFETNLTLHYTNNFNDWTTIDMDLVNTFNFRSTLTGLIQNEEYWYYITAINSKDLISTNNNNSEYYRIKTKVFTPPAVSSPDDIEYLLLSEGNSITWTITDPEFYGTYDILIDGNIVIEAEPWSAGVETVTYNVDGMSLGTHEVVLVVTTTVGAINQDIVIVEVTRNPGETMSEESPTEDGFLNIDLAFFMSILVILPLLRRQRSELV